MNNSEDKYEFIKNKICPYCQSKLKSGADFIVCSHCGTPHHKECWDENTGCTTYGCSNNPITEKKVIIEGEDVGHQTPESIRQSLLNPEQQVLIECVNCKSSIPEGSTYCPFCGFNLVDKRFDKAKEEFDKEYKRRYKDKISITRKRFLMTLGSILFVIAAVALLFQLTVSKLNTYFSSDEYKIKNTVYNWKEAWEDENIERYKSYLTSDYEYYGKDGKKIDYENRIKRIESTFKNYKNIKIGINDFKIVSDTTTTPNDKKVEFNENYESDKYDEKGKKTLRLYKGAETNNEWKIYREVFE